MLATIGKGGMASVYLGEHRILGNRVAIKVLQERHADNSIVEWRFFNEAKVIAAVKHPNIVEIYDFGRNEDNTAFIVMELLEGETLRKRIRRGIMPTRSAAIFARQLATALAEAHDHGVVHRDLKPDNVFIVKDEEVELGERVKLLDFGIAKRVENFEPTDEHTATGVLVGTPAYMSPEQCRGLGKIDARSDVYSLGVVLFRMLTRKLPFEAEGTGGMLGSHLFVDPISPREHNVDVPSELADIVMRCLQKEPAERFQSMTELVAALGNVLYGRPEPPETLSDVVGHSAGVVEPLADSDDGVSSQSEGVVFTPSVSLGAVEPQGPVEVEERDPPGLPLPAPSEPSLSEASGSRDVRAPERARSWPLIAGLTLAVAMTIGAIALTSTERRADSPSAKPAQADIERVPAAAARPPATPAIASQKDATEPVTTDVGEPAAPDPAPDQDRDPEATDVVAAGTPDEVGKGSTESADADEVEPTGDELSPVGAATTGRGRRSVVAPRKQRRRAESARADARDARDARDAKPKPTAIQPAEPPTVRPEPNKKKKSFDDVKEKMYY